MLLLLTGLVTLAGRFPIQLSQQADASLRVVPMFMAVLLVHPAEAALVGAAGWGIGRQAVQGRRLRQRQERLWHWRTTRKV